MTTRPLFTNNAATALAKAITPTDNVLQITAGTGSYFPQPTGGNYFYLTLIQINNPEVSEIVKCIDRTGDFLTVERGQEGTQPQIFNISDNVELRITAASLNLFAIGGGGGGTGGATQIQEFTATQGQTVFSLSFSYVPNQYNLAVFVNGSKQIADVNYSEASATTIAFFTGLNAGDLVEVIYNLPIAAGELDASNIRYNEGGIGAVNSTVQTKLQEVVSVKDFGAKGDGVTNDTVAIAAAIAATPAYGTLYFPPGVYVASMSIRKSNISLVGAGSASTKLIMPAGVDGIVCELGNTAAGNSAPAYTNINVSGFTFDGNYLNVPTPSIDVTGQAFATTNVSYSTWKDLICQNSQNAAFGTFINSNYNQVQVTTINGGNAIIGGGHYPNFDINSSKYNNYQVVSKNGYYGGRMLDNCYGNTLTISVDNPSYTGFVYNNQSVNSSYGNTITANIINGCVSGQGMSVGDNCFNSTITANISKVAGTGFLTTGSASSYGPSGNKFFITTYQCGGPSVVDGQYSTYNSYYINSKNDGYGSSSGSYFAIDASGDYNQYTATILGNPSLEVIRGFIFRSTASNNQILNLVFDPNLVELINDLGTNNYINFPSGIPASVASSNAITIPYYGSLINITGTNGIASISGVLPNQGRVVTLVFGSALNVVSYPSSSGNIKLAGGTTFAAAAGNTLTLISNGTYWIEISRSLTQ